MTIKAKRSDCSYRAHQVMLGAVAWVSCLTPLAAETERDPIVVYTVNYPLAYFAERVGGNRVRIVFPAPPDGDPAMWSPGAEDIANYSGANLILLNGAGYAGWVREAALPEDKLVDTSASFADAYVVESEATHSHGRGEAHTHEADTAFTTWLDPTLAITQAAAIRDALSALRPESAKAFAAGYASLREDLQVLDDDFAEIFREIGDTPVVFSHPVYQYLERRYAVNGVSLHWEPDQIVDDDDMAKLAESLLRHPAEFMIWEGEPTPESVDSLAAWTITSVVLDPCGNRPETGDYLTVMRKNTANLRNAIFD